MEEGVCEEVDPILLVSRIFYLNQESGMDADGSNTAVPFASLVAGESTTYQRPCPRLSSCHSPAPGYSYLRSQQTHPFQLLHTSLG